MTLFNRNLYSIINEMYLSRQGYAAVAIAVGVVVALAVGVGLRWVTVSRQAGVALAVPERVLAVNPGAIVSSFVDAEAVGLDPDAEVFRGFRNQFIRDRIKFIEVDLREMKLRLWQDGATVKEVAVLSKGRDGSWWETPTGKYSVISKTATAFSSIGKVWMPWSIQFYGNFFIHGWPYYPDGAPVAKTYSGGCIRLGTEDAKEVFAFADAGIPILVLDDSDAVKPPDQGLVDRASAAFAAPSLSAKAALVVDMDSGFTFFKQRSNEPLPIASITKLMTGVVASELIYLERSINILPSMVRGRISDRFAESRFWSPLFAGIALVTGNSYTAFDLLYPLLMQSSNQAAAAIGGFIGQGEFVRQMNNKAESLAMRQTTFADPSGKSAENISTAEDFAKLAKYILEKRRFLFDISRGKQYLTFGPINFGGLENYNEFVDRENLIGVKNGQTTAAGETMLTVWNLRSAKDAEDSRIAIVVLGSVDRVADTGALLDWLRDGFRLQ